MTNTFKSLICFFLTFYSLNAVAVSCEEASPNHQVDGDLYFDIVGAEPLTKVQSRRVKKLFSRIQGRWEGSGEKSHCVGSNKKTFNYRLEMEVEQNSDGKLVFDINSLETQSKSMRDETFRFLGANNQYHITKLTEDSLGLYVKYRRPNAAKTVTLLIEEIVEITADGKMLKFTITEYLNGYFSEEFVRIFHR